MTKIEQQELAELGSTPEQIAERQAWAAKLLNGEAEPHLIPDKSGAATMTGAQGLNKPARRPAVKGCCTNCGKNWSRHVLGIGDKGEEIHWCPGEGTNRFSLEKPKKEAPQTQSFLLADDLDAAVMKLLAATEALRIARDEHDAALTQYGRILEELKGAK